jgi:hypothetical protein
MSATYNDGGPAENMSLRDYFAAVVVQGLISNAKNETVPYKQFAYNAYWAADVMLAERAKMKGRRE